VRIILDSLSKKFQMVLDLLKNPPNWARHLQGTSFTNLIQILWRYWFFSGEKHCQAHYGKLAYVAVLVLLQTPVNILSYFMYLIYDWYYWISIEDLQPVFILGHYRSGTTHLHTLLNQDDRFASMTMYHTWWPNSYFSGLTRFLARLSLPSKRVMDNLAYSPDDTEEHEFAILNETPFSAYFGALYFPTLRIETFEWYAMMKCGPHVKKKIKYSLQRAAKRIFFKTGKKLMYFKNPLDTGRAGFLLDCFPNAKFIYIHRNPIEVFYSTRKMWKNYVPTTALEVYDSSDEAEIVYILWVYRRMMESYFVTKPFIWNNLVEISFDILKSHPLDTLSHIYSKLDLVDFETAREKFYIHLQKIKNYKQNKYKSDPIIEKRIRKAWKIVFDHFEHDFQKTIQGGGESLGVLD